MTEHYTNVPEELKGIPRWVAWRGALIGGKYKKVPIRPDGRSASSTDPATWCPFEGVRHIPPTHRWGVGFVLGDGIAGIDLDNCITGGCLSDMAQWVVDAFPGTYGETSPSGTGIHLFIHVNGGVPNVASRKAGSGLEFYTNGRYFTITGRIGAVCPSCIKSFDTEYIERILQEINGRKSEPVAHTYPIQGVVRFAGTDADIVSIASRARNGRIFDLLMGGDTSRYSGDNSTADIALAGILAFYSKDANQIERIMRSSGLSREKWDNRPEYLKNAIGRALANSRGGFVPDTTKSKLQAHGAGIIEGWVKNS